MAAGIVYHNITTASGVTFALACWVPDTAAPNTGAIPVTVPCKSDGTLADMTLVQSYTSRLLSASNPVAPATATATTGFNVGGTYNATPVTVADTQQAGLQLDANGYLRMHMMDGTGIPAALGSNTAANSMPVTIATDGVVATGMSKLTTGYYVTVAASQTAASLKSSTGAVGDYLEGILVLPATTAPGVVTLLDGATPTTIFSYPGGGTTALLTLTPFYIPVGAVSRVTGGWYLTTGANVSCVAMGKFS